MLSTWPVAMDHGSSHRPRLTDHNGLIKENQPEGAQGTEYDDPWTCPYKELLTWQRKSSDLNRDLCPMRLAGCLTARLKACQMQLLVLPRLYKS